MSVVQVHNCPAPHASARLSLLRRALDALTLRRSRRQLAELDPHMLRDIGLTAEQARHEAELPAWNAPAHWRR